MRQPPLAPIVAALGAVLALGLAGCAGTRAAEPTAATVNFSPKTVFDVSEAGITSTPIEVIDGAVALKAGNVVEVSNTGAGEHRVTGPGIDTGILKPGDTTTVVVTKVGDLQIVDLFDPEHHLVLRVAPRA